MKKNQEEQFCKFLISILSFELATLIIASSIFIGGTNRKLKKAREEYPNDLDSYSCFEDLPQETQKSLQSLDHELDIIFNQEDYAIENISSWEDYYLLTAILENENLNAYEKQYLYRAYEVIQDNPYLNQQDVYARLKTLDVSRKDQEAKKEKRRILSDEMVLAVASYRINLNHITFYDYENIEASIITHEMFHVLYPCSKLPRPFGEGFAELLNIEYDYDLFEDKNTNTYFQEMAYVKILCEVLGSDKVLYIASYNDDVLLEKELFQVFENKASVKRWMDVDKITDDNLFDYYEDLVFLIEKNEYSEEKQETLVSLYYQLLFGKENSTTHKYFNDEDMSVKQKVKDF